MFTPISMVRGAGIVPAHIRQSDETVEVLHPGYMP